MNVFGICGLPGEGGLSLLMLIMVVYWFSNWCRYFDRSYGIMLRVFLTMFLQVFYI